MAGHTRRALSEQRKVDAMTPAQFKRYSGHVEKLHKTKQQKALASSSPIWKALLRSKLAKLAKKSTAEANKRASLRDRAARWTDENLTSSPSSSSTSMPQ